MMDAISKDQFEHSTLHVFKESENEWVPWAMRGSYFKLLSVDERSGRFTLLIKIEKGVRAPLHRHIGAVEVYVLEGAFHYQDNPALCFSPGSYLLEEEGALHQPVSDHGAVLLAIFHGPVEGLNGEGLSAGTIDWKWHLNAWNEAKVSGFA